MHCSLCVPYEYHKKVTELKEEQPWFLLLSLISHLEMTSSCANVHNTCSTNSHVPCHHRVIKNIESRAKIVFCSFLSVPCAWKGREGVRGRLNMTPPPFKSKSKTTKSIRICLTCLFYYHHPNLRVLSFKPVWNKLLLISRPLCVCQPTAQVRQRQLKNFFIENCNHI